MKISFDLDSTLIPAGNEFSVEKAGVLHKFIGVEPIRKGTIKLFKEIKSLGHELGIYTTSYRKASKVKFNFFIYGLTLDFFINEKQNRNKLKIHQIQASKYPPAFNIDIHIDDLKGVGLEGNKYSFESIIIDPNDINWNKKVLKFIKDKTLT